MREVRIAIAVLTFGAALVVAPAARATITVGSNLSGPVTIAIGGDITAFPTAPASLRTTSPVTGTVVGGNVKQGAGGADAWGPTSLRVVHPSAGGLYQVVASGPSNPIPMAAAGIFPLAANIPIAKGDLIAIQGTDDIDGTATTSASYVWGLTTSFPAGGAPDIMNPGFTDTELLYNAQIDPANTFTVGTPTGGKKGRADVVVTVPNPGTLDAGAINDNRFAVSKKKKKSKPVLTRVTVTPTSAGPVTLALTASTAGRKILRDKGKLKTRVKFVYTPTGGSPGTQTIPLKLKK